MIFQPQARLHLIDLRVSLFGTQELLLRMKFQPLPVVNCVLAQLIILLLRR